MDIRMTEHVDAVRQVNRESQELNNELIRILMDRHNLMINSLMMIAGEAQCPDSLMGNRDIAIATLAELRKPK